MRNFLWCHYRWLLSSLALEKCKQECTILKIILVQGFCPLRIKITQFPGGFRLKTTSSPCAITSKQTMQNIVMPTVWYYLTNTDYKFTDPSGNPVLINYKRSIGQLVNWSKNDFGEIHISQGGDWAFPPVLSFFLGWTKGNSSPLCYRNRSMSQTYSRIVRMM